MWLCESREDLEVDLYFQKKSLSSFYADRYWLGSILLYVYVLVIYVQYLTCAFVLGGRPRGAYFLQIIVHPSINVWIYLNISKENLSVSTIDCKNSLPKEIKKKIVEIFGEWFKLKNLDHLDSSNWKSQNFIFRLWI